MACSRRDADNKQLAKAIEFLRDVFKYSNFKSDIQEKVVVKILARENDVAICLPRGHGRMLCYQLPAAMRAGTQATLIVYSDVERIEIQYEKLKALAVPCQILNEMTLTMNNYKILEDLTNGTIRPCLLYVHIRVLFMENVEKLFYFLREKNRLAYVVVDEIHSRQAWLDNNSVETYSKLGRYRESSPEIPWIAVTSKVHHQSVESFKCILKLKTKERGFETFVAPVFRPNVRIECIVDDYLGTSFHHLKEFVLQQLKSPMSTDELPIYNSCGVIVCKNKNKCMEVATELRQSGVKIDCLYYSLNLEEKKEMINSLKFGTLHVLAVTHYAEMNIVWPPMKFVVHWGLPSSMMTYYHNIAMAGTDGLIARCRMYVTEKSLNYYDENRHLMPKSDKIKNEHEKQKYLIFLNASNMKDFCTAIKCRHAYLADYFGDKPPLCIDKCDVCVAVNNNFRASKKSSKSSNESAKRQNKMKSLTKKLADTKF